MTITELFFTSRDTELNTYLFTVWVANPGAADKVYSAKVYLNRRGKFVDWEIYRNGTDIQPSDELEGFIMDFIETNWERIQFMSTASGNKLSDVPAKLKKVVVRWVSVYETTLMVDAAMSEDEIRHGPAADIEIDVPGSEYQRDTWEVDAITIH